MTHGAIEWMDIPAKDLKASTDFYRTIFGWKVQTVEQWPDYPMFEDPSGHVGGGFMRSETPLTGGGILLYITVKSIEETLAVIARNGGATVKEKHLISPDVGWWATFRDPGGNVVGLYEKVVKG